jgi:hypothetical protein
MVASGMLNAFYLEIQNKLKYQEWYFDIENGSALAHVREL